MSTLFAVVSTLKEVPPTISLTINCFPAVGATVMFPPAAVFVIVLSLVSILPEDLTSALIG